MACPMSSLRPLLPVLPQAERPPRDTDKRSGVLDRETEFPPPREQLRRQRIALLAAEFQLSRPKGHLNAGYQKGYGTQVWSGPLKRDRELGTGVSPFCTSSKLGGPANRTY